MDTPSPTQEHCPTCRRATSPAVEPSAFLDAANRLAEVTEELVARLDDLIESQFEELLEEE